jgi:prevent-host-death family protein
VHGSRPSCAARVHRTSPHLGSARLTICNRTPGAAAGWCDPREARKGSRKVKEVPLAAIKDDDFSRYLREAAKGEIVITRHGKPAGVLIGSETEDDWFDYRLENDPRFLRRIADGRASLRSGRGIRLEEIK